jgi:hypothetical protein
MCLKEQRRLRIKGLYTNTNDVGESQEYFDTSCC